MLLSWQKVRTLVSIKWQQPEDGESGVAKATGRATHMAVLQKTILVKMVEEPRIRMKWVREKKAQFPGNQYCNTAMYHTQAHRHSALWVKSGNRGNLKYLKVNNHFAIIFY